MKKIKTTLLLTALLVAGCKYAIAQDCNTYFPVKVGTQMEYTQYDGKNKLTGTSKQVITGNETIPGGVKINFDSESFDKKGVSQGKAQLSVKCENGVYTVDMKNIIPSQTLAAYKDMDVEVNGNNLTTPSSLTVGQSLPDANVTMIVKSQGFQIMKMIMTISNRKVEANEKVTTAAGTYDCYKISYTVLTDMMVKVETKVTEWSAINVGLVKSETYDKSGKLVSSNQLTAIK